MPVDSNKQKCSSNENILPIDLDMSNMVNNSEQLTNLTYDFTACKEFGLTIECPSWMRRGGLGCNDGVIKIEQRVDNTNYDILNFTTVGKLTGSGPDNHIVCYYFPNQSLNLYKGVAPSGGEIVIELIEKSTKSKKDRVRILLFIPVTRMDSVPEKSSSNKWFNGIYPKLLLTKNDTHTHNTSSLSLNDIIPKSAFWVYNDIKIHGECDTDTQKEFKENHAIFFVDEPIVISAVLNDMFRQITGKDPIQQVDLSNNTDPNWLDAWYPTSSKLVEDSADDKPKKMYNARDFTNNKVNKGSIFRNEMGTTMGPGLHNKAGDPFSLTCEPIVDLDDKPIAGKDRLEWVKDVYNGVPEGMKQMVWVFIFIIVLTGILMSLHIFIFKNIGLFITQNEIAERIDK